jgi:hypothetical protein
MQAWLARGAAAARVGSDRPDLWLPAALAWIVSVGWLPFVLVVVPLPGEGELVAFGARLFTSSLWPLNAVLLVAGGLALVVLALLLRAVGEATMARSMATTAGSPPPGGRGGRASRDVAALFVVRLATALPTALALVAAGLLFVAVAPGEFQSPDIGGEVYVRIAGRLLAALVVLALALVIGAVLAAVAGRRATGRAAVPPTTALGDAVMELAHRPGPLLGVAFTTLLAGTFYLVGSYLLLRVLWAPIAAALLGSSPIGAGDLLLLVGFVAIWLCLVLGGGAVHAWASAWWALELRADRGPPEPASAAEGIRAA